MANNKILVENFKGNKLVVQPSMIPQGFRYIKEYKEPTNQNKLKVGAKNAQGRSKEDTPNQNNEA
ncbi:hypothetical protein HRF87_01915 [Bacillus sp. CRN 9]|nr:hypothetical protein [Bacillus sp. CRN 9]